MASLLKSLSFTLDAVLGWRLVRLARFDTIGFSQFAVFLVSQLSLERAARVFRSDNNITLISTHHETEALIDQKHMSSEGGQSLHLSDVVQ